MDVAKSISEGLARKVLAANVNGQVWDATRPINDDATINLLTWNEKDGKNTFWHSSAHLMAEAVESMFPGVKFWVGPPVDNGFYYDMDLGDSTKRSTPEISKPTTKPVVITPSVLKTRENKLAQSIIVSDPDVIVKLYDNGEIDDDTISIYLNKRLVLSNKRLSAAPIKLNFSMQDEEDQELTMVAENLGRIPPNTSLMIVEAGDQRFEVRITSSEQKNAVVRFKYQKPK